MLRKAGIVAALMLSLPTLANAWTLTAKIGSGAGTITSDVVTGTVSKTATSAPVIGYFKTADNTVPAQNITVTPDAGNYLISSVIVDGARATANTDGTYTVNAGSPVINHSMVVYYTAVTSTVTVNQPGVGGTVYAQHLSGDPALGGKPFGAYSRTYINNLKPGSWVRVYAAPNADYKVATINGTDYSATTMSGEAKYVDVQVSGNTGVSATFSLVPSIYANLVPFDSLGKVNFSYKSGQTVTLQATARTNDTVSYAWAVNGAPVAGTSSSLTIAPTSSCKVTVTITSSNGSVVVSKDVNLTVTDVATVANNICLSCHTQRNAQIVADFGGSPHWNNLRNQGDLAVAGDGKGSCATQKCHFKSVEQPGCATCHSGALQADGTFAHYSATHVDFATLPTQDNSCFRCHQGSHHGTPTAEYQKSSHYLNPYSEGIVRCQDCHNPHSTKASFPSYDATTYAQTQAGSCDKCHTGKYGIFNADGSMKQPHTASKTMTVNTNQNFKLAGVSYTNRAVLQNISSSYVTAGTSCTDCHGHNNQVNAEYADTMHADPYGRWKGARAWKFAGYSAADANTFTPATVAGSDGCVRCHTSTGFRNFVDSGYKDLRAWGFKNLNDKTTELISCNTCHVTGAGAITGEAEVGLPEGNPNGWNPNSIRGVGKPYQAYYNVSTAASGRLYTAVQYSDFKESNVCVPCHSGRNGASNGDTIKQLANFANFTTLAATDKKIPGLPHGVYQAAVLDAKFGYQFSKYTTAGNTHATIGVGGAVNTGSTVAGPCVSCHMDLKTATGKTGSATYRKHNFEIADANGVLPNVCTNCHSTNFTKADLDTASANFQAAVSALGEILSNASLNKYGVAVLKYNTAISNGHGGTYAGYQLVSTTTHIVPQSLTPAQNAELVGAIYNMNLLWGLAYTGTDAGAFAHNPQYVKQLVSDTINVVRAATTASVADAINQAVAPAVAGATAGFTADQAAAANVAVADGAKNHYAAGNSYRVQYVVGNATCATCHNPNESDVQKAARLAWADSGHGETTAAPWMPGSSHLWRNAGATTDFSTTIPKNDCQRCHTADGFAQFVSSDFTNITPVDTAANAIVNSPIDCQACHTDNSFARRPVKAVATFYNISTVDNVTKATVKARIAANFPDTGDSNICISCHSARLSGSALVAAAQNGLSMNNSGFQNSHYMGAAGMMYVKAGFTAFTSATAVIGTSTYGASLTSTEDGGAIGSTHRHLGTAAIVGDHGITAGTLDAGGPCVTCHMQGTNTAGTLRTGAGHSLAITQETITQVCNNCHKSEAGFDLTTIDNFKAHFLEPNSEVFQDALTLATKELLDNYQISYNSAAYPYFYDENLPLVNGKKQTVTDWTRGGRLDNAAALKLEGACFNINLLSREPAAYAHSRTYTRRLVYDTIDFLDNGAMDLSAGATALASGLTDASGNALYTKGTVAYDGGAPYKGGTLNAGTSEAMTFLLGWGATGAWSTPERP